GISPDRIFVTGNPIKQVMDSYGPQIAKSDSLKQLGVSKKGFFLVTMHRAENVDREDTLRALVNSLVELHAEYKKPVVCSLHPRTRSKLEKFGIDYSQAGLKFMEPFGFFDFVNLEKSAFCVISDSGTVQEEACI